VLKLTSFWGHYSDVNTRAQLESYNFKEAFSDITPNIVRVIKSRRMMWAGHVAHMGDGRGVNRVLVGRSEGKRPPVGR
jgi:hypothetical protein